jgi:hypothetical protein
MAMQQEAETIRCPECKKLVCKRKDGVLFAVLSNGKFAFKTEYILRAVYCCGEMVASAENNTTSTKNGTFT